MTPMMLRRERQDRRAAKSNNSWLRDGVSAEASYSVLDQHTDREAGLPFCRRSSRQRLPDRHQVDEGAVALSRTMTALRNEGFRPPAENDEPQHFRIGRAVAAGSLHALQQ